MTPEPETSGKLPEVIDQDDLSIGSLEENRLGQRSFAETLAAEFWRHRSYEDMQYT